MRPLRARASVAAARSLILLEGLKHCGSTFFQAGSPKSILSWLHRRRWTRRLELPKQVRGLSLARLFNGLCPTVAPQAAPQQHPAEVAQVPVGAVAEVQEAAAADARVAVAVAAAPALPLRRVSCYNHHATLESCALQALHPMFARRRWRHSRGVGRPFLH
jgi:hypothetical protein